MIILITFVRKHGRLLAFCTGPFFISAPPQTRRYFYFYFYFKLTAQLEATKSFACRVILQDWKMTHDELLLKADLPILAKRCDLATLC